MLNFVKFFLTSLFLVNHVYSDDPPYEIAPTFNIECPNDFPATCNLQCPDGNYLLDEKGCPTCACAPNDGCPLSKCRSNCGKAGYKLDENGCQTCVCASKETVQCSQLMCRMYCSNGFKRDENGCEYCACSDTPQECPQLKCQQTCTSGYRKDYSGCQTCECNDEPKDIVHPNCPPSSACRMYCTYGYQRDENGCEMCECDWTPVAEKIACSERTPCEGTRVCNLNLKLCESVDPVKVIWFLYDFEVQPELFKDHKFVQTFKNGFIRNVADKYDLSVAQITVSSVEGTGLTSFQIMPFFTQDMEEFERKMDQIDVDLNSHEFRSVLPSVVQVAEMNNGKFPSMGRFCQRFKHYARAHPKTMVLISLISITLLALILIIISVVLRRRCSKHPTRSESKVPIYDSTYHQAPSDDEQYRAVAAPDGTTYLVVESDEMQSSNEKRILV